MAEWFEWIEVYGHCGVTKLRRYGLRAFNATKVEAAAYIKTRETLPLRVGGSCQREIGCRLHSKIGGRPRWPIKILMRIKPCRSKDEERRDK